MKEERIVLKTLRQKGPMSHEELSKTLDYNWDETQKMIRRLRNHGLVSITLDRRYEANSKVSEKSKSEELSNNPTNTKS